MKSQFPGAKVQPGDLRYPTLVRGFNQRFVGTPAYVQVCGDENQVLQTVQQAVDQNLRITVRGGGHCYEDFVSGNDGGVIIDLSPLNKVYKDEKDDLYCVEGGCTLWNVYTQLFKEYGKTIPGGSCYSVGAGGHVIGGGYGLLSRLHGLTVDYLSAVELIYVDNGGKAQLIKVSRDSPNQDEKDLFWAHQGGGGGNFGIVTKYWFNDPPDAPDFGYLNKMWATIPGNNPIPELHLQINFDGSGTLFCERAAESRRPSGKWIKVFMPEIVAGNLLNF